MNSTIVRRSVRRHSLSALSALLALNCMTLFSQKPTNATVKKSTATPAANAISKMQEGKIWLSLDVVEHQYNSSGNEVGKEKYRSDIDLQVIDSATNRSNTVRSGETVPLQARRTYYIVLSEVPQSYGMTTRLAGQQTQIIRTPKSAGDDDVMFERKFVLNSRPGSAAGAASQREMGKSIPLSGGMVTKTPAPSDMPARPSKYGSLPNLGNNLSNPNYYVIQYCSLKSQDDALQARSFLMRNGVRDARVEVYVDRFGQSYYRLRSGSYIDPSLARSTIEGTLWKNRQSLGLKQKPIIVKAGV
ncbi:MAG: hypothetical protein JNN25_08200 [Candidatus Kapabacteria bacterium]|nr:hypothetical protein [Candidatus Kapabacteria bacterium]